MDRDDLTTYYARYELTVPLTECDEEQSELIEHINGAILKRVELDDSDVCSETQIGSLSARRVSGHATLIDADKDSAELGEVMVAVSGLKQRPPTVLYVATVDISPAYRGLGLSLPAVYQFFVRFALTPYDVCAVIPAPTQTDISDEERVNASVKLRDYYSVLGFREVPRMRVVGCRRAALQPGPWETFARL